MNELVMPNYRAPYRELEIRRTIGSRNTPRVQEPLEEMLPAATFIEQLEEVRARGTRVVLLRIESAGGLVDESFLIYEALRRFSRDGGRVVVHVAGWCGSTATFIALAGDYVVLDPAAKFLVHGMNGYAPASTRELNRRVRAIYAERSGGLTPNHELDEWLTLEAGAAVCLTGEAAVCRGWADFVAQNFFAQHLAGMLAEGRAMPSARQTAILEDRT